MILIPTEIDFIIKNLETNGYECFAVGGCVRDSLMCRMPEDWDFTTNATPDEISECFRDYRLITVGSKYGTIGVINNENVYEITTFRKDGAYSDSRHPDSIEYSSNIEDDLARRDFTINSMAYSPQKGVIDPYGGREDLSKQIIRCTGDPYKRFEEDALRIIRALRFSSRFGFSIEEETSKAIVYKKDSLSAVHPQRLRKELLGMIMGPYAYRVLEKYPHVLASIIPDFEKTFDYPQNNPHHCFDVWMHTLKALSETPSDEEIKLCILFHDIGKPFVRTTDKNGIDHFKCHQIKSTEIAESTLQRFGFPAKTVRNVVNLIRHHDERFKNGDKDIKRLLGILGEELFSKFLIVAKADISAQSEYRKDEKLNLIKSVEQRAKEIVKNNECYSISQLLIDGNDLKSLGYNGKQIGEILSKLLDSVISSDCENNREALIKQVSSFIIDKS